MLPSAAQADGSRRCRVGHGRGGTRSESLERSEVPGRRVSWAYAMAPRARELSRLVAQEGEEGAGDQMNNVFDTEFRAALCKTYADLFGASASSVEHVDAHHLRVGRVHERVKLRCDRLRAECLWSEREAGGFDDCDAHHLEVP